MAYVVADNVLYEKQGQQHARTRVQKQQEVVQPEPEENFNDEDEDNTYIRFIASTIHADGLDVGEVEIGPIAPVVSEDQKSAISSNTTLIDDAFWDKLDKIDSVMKMNEIIDIDADGNLICKQCNKTFQSTTRLLQHYWNQHQKVLKEYTVPQ